ncbi:Membrane protein involved in the export of O-antigen and teichoic acid [Parapedobacter composti]|uniref:Membrane protein involved in the export of O-antigen and teichoic acid n=1 Tax=Parapedobacter composti TaxID=623281 RepID=A0A1I1IWQ4_9SPHI|nr:lipopolysaccharide biosynthesis protein [Parapedobacter composti]SFC38768.1 Membrane protein involved in the export of O-antigen and teichoic acid [Parapedobacter composti]
MSSLRKKTVSGLFWTFTQQFSVQAINFVVQLILARLLVPEDFGIIAMLSVFIAIGNTLVDNGLTSSLIRTKDADQADYSTVFFMNLSASIGIYLIVFFCAPLIAKFFKQPILTDVIRLYTTTFIIRAFSQVQQTKLTKEMQFRLQMTVQIPSVIIAGIGGIIMAYKGLGVWALVWMALMQTSVSSLQLWLRSDWHPSLIFSLEKLKAHLNFGYKLTLSSLLNTLFNNVYNIVIGRYYSAAQLGFYNRADTLRMFPIQNLATALNKVTYPMFASIQDDDAKLRSAYSILMKQVLFWLAPVMAILVIVAEPLFRLLLTDKWLPAAPYFQLLCLAGLLYPIHAYNLNILNIKGRSDLFLRLEIIKKIIVVIGVICAIPFGIFGLIYFQIVSSILSFFINTYYSGRLIAYNTLTQLLDIAPIFIIAATIGCGIGWINENIVHQLSLPDYLVISIVGFVYLCLYFLTSYLFGIAAVRDFKNFILKR